MAEANLSQFDQLSNPGLPEYLNAFVRDRGDSEWVSLYVRDMRGKKQRPAQKQAFWMGYSLDQRRFARNICCQRFKEIYGPELLDDLEEAILDHLGC